MTRFLAAATILIFTGCSLFVGCSPAPTVVRAPSPKVRPLVDVEPSPAPDAVARFIAGLPGGSGSPLRDLEGDPAWVAHQRDSDSDWFDLLTNRLPVMRAFGDQELNPVHASKTLLYAFGGPDIITARALFPAMDNYILIGLEPAGTVPGVERLRERPLETVLPRFRMTLDSVLRRSFFITREMDSQLRSQITDGVLPVMLAELVRSGHTIEGVRHVRILPDGTLATRDPAEPWNSFTNQSSAIRFHAGNPAETKTLLYVSANLMSPAFDRNEGLRKFVAAQRGATGFFKATSYTVHQAQFAGIRDTILDTCSAVVQDDSGVPYRLFDQKSWAVQLYGGYEKPYGSFSFREQPDLRQAYAAGARQLNFRIGYGFSKVPSNLLVARRRQAPGI